jgi:hypothetical protein
MATRAAPSVGSESRSARRSCASIETEVGNGACQARAGAQARPVHVERVDAGKLHQRRSVELRHEALRCIDLGGRAKPAGAEADAGAGILVEHGAAEEADAEGKAANVGILAIGATPVAVEAGNGAGDFGMHAVRRHSASRPT